MLESIFSSEEIFEILICPTVQCQYNITIVTVLEIINLSIAHKLDSITSSNDLSSIIK